MIGRSGSQVARGIGFALVVTAIVAALLPRGATHVLLVQLVLGLVIGLVGTLGPPSGPDAVRAT